jgi:dienelactone hydrolase
MPTRPRTQLPSTPTPQQFPRRHGAAARRARGRVVRRRRLLALVVVVACAAALVAVLSSGGSTRAPAGRHHANAPTTPASHPAAARPGGRAAVVPPPPRSRPSAQFAVGKTVVRLVDGTRPIHLAGGSNIPRTLVTYVRYPASGPAGGSDRVNAAPARAAGPFPLIVFGHGFDVYPGLYAQILDAWARAGYVVAAPVFPRANPGAPGGATEADLPNQPADLRFVISRMLRASNASGGLLSGLIAAQEISVAGQSDGGDTALAVAYDPRFRDSRVRAAVILSGAEIPNLTAFSIAPGGPPLLATQGTADPINLPSATSAFYAPAPAPKYLLELLGASHLPPYSNEQPQLGIVERVSTAFLDGALKHGQRSLARMRAAGNVSGIATLSADP